MNKTVTVNLGGIVFHIDENAYDALQKYLNSIRSHFTSADGRDEIMQDIESRIAEMFLERAKDSKQVITLTDVEQVTAIMGKPEDFAGEGEPKSSSAPNEEAAAGNTYKRRLFRNPDDKMLGGVCSGIAAYFDTDVVWIRIIWAILFFAFGSGLLLYIILWIVIPMAKTTAEKLQMRGEPINVSNIEKNIKEEAEAIKQKMEQWGKENGKQIGTGIGRFFEALGEVFRILFSFIGKLILTFFAFIGIIICLSLFIGLLGILGLPGIHLWNMTLELFNNQSQLVWAYIGLMLAIGLPFLMLVIRAIGVIFNIKTMSKFVNMTALSLWLGGIAICILMGIKLGKEFREDESITQEITLVRPVSDTLYLKSSVANNEYNESKYRKRFWHHGIRINEDVFESDKIEFDIAKEPAKQFTLVKMMTASGSTRDQAKERASHTIYSFAQKDSLLVFDAQFTLPPKEKYRRQEVQLILRIPVGKYVYIDESMHSILYNVDNVKGILDDDMVGRTWKMTEHGLICVDCTGRERTKYSENADKDDEDAVVDIRGDSASVKIDKHGVSINAPDAEVKMDENGFRMRKKEKKN